MWNSKYYHERKILLMLFHTFYRTRPRFCLSNSHETIKTIIQVRTLCISKLVRKIYHSPMKMSSHVSRHGFNQHSHLHTHLRSWNKCNVAKKRSISTFVTQIQHLTSLFGSVHWRSIYFLPLLFGLLPLHIQFSQGISSFFPIKNVLRLIFLFFFT